MLSLALLFMMPGITGVNSATQAGSQAVAAQEATPVMVPERAAQAGVPACVPRPSIEPPPMTPGDSGEAAKDASAAPGQRPCPEGFVPKPIGRQVPRGRSVSGAPVFQGVSSIRSIPLSTAAYDYYYAGAYQNAGSAGGTAFFTQHQPVLAPGDSHTLVEISVKSTDVRQIVEVGWTVDRSLNGDDLPHLFVAHWVDGIPACYNGCGWVPFSSTLSPGMTLTSDGTGYQYSIFFWQGNWWIGYQGQWVGFFPGSLWNGTFQKAGMIQWFGEVSVQSGTIPPLSSMANSFLGNSGNPSTAQVYFAGLYNDDGSTRAATLSLMNWFSYLSWYNTSQPAGLCSNCFLYGGHGGAP